MTTFTSCAITDLLRQHDTYRLTILPGSHILSAIEPDLVKTAELGAGMTAIYDAGGIGNVIPLFTNPYKEGDLAATIDVLVMSDGGSVADMLNGILDAANAPEFADVEIGSVEQIVGVNSSAPGTTAADQAVYSPAAAGARAAEASAAAVADTNWLTRIENDLGTAGKYLVIAGAAYGALWLYRNAKRVRRLVA